MRFLSASLLCLVLSPATSLADDCTGSTNPARIIPACTRIIQSADSDPEAKAAAHDQRAWAYNAKGDHARAMEDANKALQLNPKLASAYGNRGWAQNDPDSAIADHNEALRLNPKLWTVYDLRGWAYNAKGEPNRALADYTEALRIRPSFYVALNGRGNTYVNLGQYDLAIKDFTAALGLKPGLRSSYSYRAWAYIGKGDYDHAIADYNHLLGDKADASTYADRCWVYYLKGDYQTSIADCNKAIQLDPSSSISFSNRAETNNASGEYDRAIADAEASARLSASNKFAYDARGRAFLGKRDYDTAIADFNRSLGLDATYLFALIGRGKAFLAKNDREGAAADFKAAVSLRAYRHYEKQAQAEAAKQLTALKIDPQPATPPPPTTSQPATSLPVTPQPAITQTAAPQPAPLRPVIRPLSGRFALLIGNQSYNDKVGPLKNPHIDVARVSSALKSVGFKVTEILDGDYRSIEVAVNSHIATLRSQGQASIGLLYYSGHGAADAVTKINYLIPVDVPTADDAKLWLYSINLNKLVERLREEAPETTHYVVFDACRNELQLTHNGQKALAQKGFAPIAYMPGVMVAYATAPGMTATDGGLGGGPYAKALADELVRPGVDSVLVFMQVARRVYQQVGQNPYMSISTMPQVYFAGSEGATRVDIRN